MNQEFNPPNQFEMTPPVEGGELEPPPSTWPSVIGTVSIVFAAIGLICFGCGTINTIAGPWLAGMMPANQRPATPPPVQLTIQITQMCVSTLLSVWLLFAGIGTLKRRRWGRSNHVGWSFAKIILSLIGIIPGLIFMQATVDQVNDQLSKNGKPPFTLTVEIMMAFMFISLVWFLIYPSFLIVWFSRRKIKAETDQWR